MVNHNRNKFIFNFLCKVFYSEFNFVLTFSVKPQQNPKQVQEFYELREGEPNEIRMMFRANPKPTDGQWTINTANIAIGSESLDSKYKSSFIEEGVRPVTLSKLTMLDKKHLFDRITLFSVTQLTIK